MRLADTHCHIHDREFARDLDETIERARAAGVELIVTLGTDVVSSRRAVALAERDACVVAAAGVHPHDAKDATAADLDELEKLAAHPRVALVGEIGLDFYRDLSPRAVQVDVMSRQLETARRAGKPIAVHVRESNGAVEPLLRAWSAEMGGALPDGRPLGVMHYFSEGAEAALRYVELGFMISVHTSVTHPRKSALQEMARDIPMEHLVVETDSPYGAPQRYRGKRNEPAYVGEAVTAIAELKGLDAEEVAEATTANALRLVGAAVATGRGA